MRLAEAFKIVPILSDQDLNAGALMPGDSINMSRFHHCTYLVNYQTIGVAANYVKVFSGLTDGAVTTALTFAYAFGGAAGGAAGCDVLAAWATSANLSVAHATYDNFLLVIEVDAKSMGAGHKWLTLQFEDTDTGATGNVSVVAVLQPRFTGNRSVTALT